MFLALLRANFNPRYARAKMILSRAKKCGQGMFLYFIIHDRCVVCYNEQKT